jgi:two-component system, OmpR family, phosphate regulon sensor histidine kinase PhoR
VKKSTFLIIVFITGIALAGIIIIQFYWIRNAVQLQEEQFDSRVRLALKGTVNQMFESKSDTCPDRLFCGEACFRKDSIRPDGLNITTLNTIIRDEFAETGLYGEYVYGIYSPGANHTEYISNPAYTEQILSSDHSVSLSCIYRGNAMMLSAWFPDEKHRALEGIFFWLVVCFTLLAILVFGFIFNIYSFLRQKRISEMKSDFVNNITHEFKTPIATVSLASEMLLKPAVLASEEKARKYASIIYDENNRLKNQVEHILQLAVLERGKYTLKIEPVDMHDLIRKVAENIRLLVREKNGDIRIQLDAIHHQVFADHLHLENVITNLLDNASKYSPGSPDIRISTFNRNDFLVVAVEDSGIGISSKNQKYIFRKMYRVHTGNLHNVKGSGLGLYYVKTLVEAHNGSVSLHSEPGKGSRFEFTLPLNYLSQVLPNTKTDES